MIQTKLYIQSEFLLLVGVATMYTNLPKIKKRRVLWRRIREHVVFCLSVSTIHGLIHVVRKRRLVFERLFWLILVVACFAIATDQALKAWNRYETSPVVTTLDKDFNNWIIDYPSIILCIRNINPQAYKLVQNLNKEEPFIDNTDDLQSYMKDLLFTTYHTDSQLEKYANGSKKDNVPTSMYLDLARLFSYEFPKNTPPIKKRKKPKISTVWPKNVDGQYDLILTEYGVCHAFHSKYASYFDIKYSFVTLTASPFTISDSRNFTINEKFKSDYEEITKTKEDEPLNFAQRDIFSDYYLFVLSSNEMIDIASRYLFSKEGTNADVYIDVVDIVSEEDIRDVSPERRNCRFSDENEGLQSPFYSYNLCRMECRKQLALKYCNCTPYYYKRKKEPICNMTGMYCLSKYPELITLTDPKEETNLCPCLQTCNLQRITLRSAGAQQWFMGTQLQVLFDSFPEEQYRRSLILTKTDVLVQVGSLFALFLGCSVLSLIEIPYFLTLRFFWGVFGSRRIEPVV